jgi:predicted ribosome quality control (RQC) complex YloA/Tae2 family protein
MERGLSSFDIYVIVAELQDLRGCYVEKIYQLSREEILLRVQQTSTKKKRTTLHPEQGAVVPHPETI